jgi:putative methionine-R-sulfoxide reductase with GAF domain
MNSLICDESGRVWTGSSRKIYKYDESTQQFMEIPIMSTDSSLYTGPVFTMPENKTWLITSSGFFGYDPAKDHFSRILTEIPVPPRYNIRSFGFQGSTVFFGHNGYVYRYNVTTKKLDSLEDRNMRKIFPVNEDSILINTWSIHSYWYNFRDRRVTEAMPPDKLRGQYAKKSFAVRGMTMVSPNMYLIPTVEGIYEYNNSTAQYRQLTLYRDGYPVSASDFANSIYSDNEGYVWLATVDGIARFPLNERSFGLIRIRQRKNELPVGVDNIRSITEDGNGNLWLATGNGFVCWKRSANQWEVFLPEEGSTKKPAFPSFRGISYDGKNILLGPADLGIWIYDPVNNSYKRPVYASADVQTKSERDFIDAITTLRNGDHLIMGRDALYLLGGKDHDLKSLNIEPASQNTNFAHQGKDGMIWLTTQRGLHLMDESLHYLGPVKLPTKNPFISAGFMLPDNRFLFSIDSGLYTAKYNGKETLISKFTNQFDNIFVTSLFFDDNGILWATSENGIYRFDPSSSKLNLFDYSDNVQGYGFNSNSWHKSKDGILFMGGINGLNYFDPGKFSRKDDSLRVYIQQVKNSHHDSLTYPLNRQLVLTYAQRSLEAEFVAPYYNNPDKVKFRYKLDGLDNEWKYLGSNYSVRFTSLPAGDYTLLVEASVNNVDWIAAANSFSFRIRKPFWLQGWFIGISLLALLSLAWLIIRNRNRKIAEQQEELEAEQAINYFSSSMYNHQSVEEILWDVARNCIGRLKFEDCVIYLLDEERKLLVQKAAHGPKSPKHFEIMGRIEVPLGSGITGLVAQTGKPEIVYDTTRDPRYIVDDEFRLSEIAVPIIADGKVLGVIDCEHSKKGFFTQRHLSILTTIASLCANKIVKAKAEAEKIQAEQVLMATKQKMSEVEMQALRAQMNPHFIFNCLNSINRYIVKSDQATASLYLTRFAKLIRLILDNSNSKTVSLSNELEALRLYIEMEAIRFEKQFTYEISVEEGLQTDAVYVPPLIIQPFVENAIWHGLLHKEEAGHLSIRIRRKKRNVLECAIEDNGVGREKARELKSKTASSKKSLGMKLTEDRLALLNKQAKLDASVEIEDLMTEQGEAAGTKVILKIPVDG